MSVQTTAFTAVSGMTTRASQKDFKSEEIVEEAKAIERQGHKRLLLICGEDPRKTNVKHFYRCNGGNI